MIRSRCRSYRFTQLALAATVALAAAGCGSSSSSSAGGSASSSGGSSASGSSQVAQAQAIVNAHLKDPTSIGITQPVGKPIPTGKKIVFINCGPEGCTRAGAAFKQAAAVLGWQVTELTPKEPTPGLIQAAFDQAVNLHPDAVVSSALPTVAFQRQAQQLKSMHIPLISLYGPDPTGGPLLLQIFGQDGNAGLAKVIAAKTVADIGGKGTVGAVILTGFEVIGKFVGVYSDEVKALCPSCQVKTTTIQPTSLGTTDGTDIVNFLRANPDIRALFLGYEGVGGDLDTAAKSAGITLPKSYSIATTAPGLAEVRSGLRTATSPTDYLENGWLVADALARIFTGQTAAAVKYDTTYPTPVIWSKEYNNIPPNGPTGFPSTVADYQAQFKKLWGK